MKSYLRQETNQLPKVSRYERFNWKKVRRADKTGTNHNKSAAEENHFLCIATAVDESADQRRKDGVNTTTDDEHYPNEGGRQVKLQIEVTLKWAPIFF